MNPRTMSLETHHNSHLRAAATPLKWIGRIAPWAAVLAGAAACWYQLRSGEKLEIEYVLGGVLAFTGLWLTGEIGHELESWHTRRFLRTVAENIQQQTGLELDPTRLSVDNTTHELVALDIYGREIPIRAHFPNQHEPLHIERR